MEIRLNVRLNPVRDDSGNVLKANHLEARKRVANKGGLPPHVLVDQLVCKPESPAQTTSSEPMGLGEFVGRIRANSMSKDDPLSDLCPLLSRELLVHPRKKEEFRSEDIFDPVTNLFLPWNEIVRLSSPSEVLGPKKALFIDPKDIVEEDGKLIVVPDSVKIIYPFVQASKEGSGKFDAATRMPLQRKPKDFSESRTLWKSPNMSITPIFRGVGGFPRYIIFTCTHNPVVWKPDEPLGVSWLAHDVLIDSRLFAKDLTLTDIKKLVAGENIEALRDLPIAQLEAVRKLAQELRY